MILVELLVAPGTSDAIAPLAAALSRWVDLRAPDPALPAPVARLASAPDAPGVERALDDPACPLAVVVPSVPSSPAVARRLGRAAVVLVPAGADTAHLGEAIVPADPEDGGRENHSGLSVDSTSIRRTAGDLAHTSPVVVTLPAGPGAAATHAVLSPFVRARWRERLFFPADYHVSVGFDGDTLPSQPDLVETALTLAAAAAVREPHLELALALGTPVVTDRASAEALGLVADVDVLVVVDAGDRLLAVTDLAADPARTASLSRAGRLAAERRDLASVAAVVARALGLLDREPEPGPTGNGPTTVRARLDELRTPLDAPIRRRIDDHRRHLSAGRSPRLAAFPGARP